MHAPLLQSTSLNCYDFTPSASAESRKRNQVVATTVPDVGGELPHEAMVGDAAANKLTVPEQVRG